MKRTLFEQIKVLPYEAGYSIERNGCLSAVLGIECSEATGTPTMTVALSHCDTEDGVFDGVPDTRALLFQQPVALAEGGVYNLNIDMLGCKRFVKITPTIIGTATCVYALAVGDGDHHPVM